MITREWKAVQRVKPSDQIASTRGKVALRYGPLIYNIERVDQDITKPLAPNSPLATEWRGDLLGGVAVIKGDFADGSKLPAIPNYARVNRETGLPPEAGPMAADPSFNLGANAQAPQTARPQGQRPVLPTTSIVWISEA